MIIRSVQELLYNHECVIIPEFGAFITKYVPAKIDSVTHRFTPPSKEMVFNRFLSNDDSLLVDYISLKQGIAKEEARLSVHNFVLNMTRSLQDDKKIDLEGLGTLSLVNDDDYVFKIDDRVNLFGDAFGLTTFTMLPVFRIENLSGIDVADSKQGKDNVDIFTFESVNNKSRMKGRFRWLHPIGYAAAACAFMFCLCWGVEESSSNLAGWNLFSFSSPNRFLAHHCNAFDAQNEKTVTLNDAVQKYTDEVTKTVNDVTTEILVHDVVVTPETTVVQDVEETPEVVTATDATDIGDPVNVSDNVAAAESVKSNGEDMQKIQEPVVIEKDNRYFVIAGSFKERARAERCLSNIDKKVFSDAEILDMTSTGFWRVAYSAFPDKTPALVSLEMIRAEYDSTAWLLFLK